MANTSRGGTGVVKRQVCFSGAGIGTVYDRGPARRQRPSRGVRASGVCFPVMLNVEPSPAEWAWFAGLFEAQGSLVLHRSSRWRCRFQLKSTDEDVVRLARERVGGRLFGPYAYRSSDGSHRKPFWLWVSDGLDVLEIAAQIWPWLGERRRAKLREFGLEPRPASLGAAASLGHDPR